MSDSQRQHAHNPANFFFPLSFRSGSEFGPDLPIDILLQEEKDTLTAWAPSNGRLAPHRSKHTSIILLGSS